MENNLSLDEIGLRYNTDKSSDFHNYLDLYDKTLESIRYKNNNILEIGILNGDSLFMFGEYFTRSRIFAFDIQDKKYLKKENFEILVGDQSDRKFLSDFSDNFFDFIIDDGSHKMEHQQISIGTLFKKLKSGGIYILEDLHTSLPNYIETINHGTSLFGITEENRTIDFLNGLKNEDGPNKYLTEDEYKYLKDNVFSLDIIETSRRNDNNLSITSVIIKK